MSKKIINFIKNVRQNDTFEKYRYSDIFQKFLNGECETLVGWLYFLNNEEGNHCDIFLVPINEFGEEEWEDRLYHSVYSYKGKYYDINGMEDNPEIIARKLPYFVEGDFKIKIEEWEISKKNFYSKIPEHLLKKKKKKILKI